MKTKKKEWINKLKEQKETLAIVAIALISIIFQLSSNNVFEFHRDELLYFSLGEHLDFGYYSVPPFIGLMAFVSTKIFGYTLFAARFFPALAGGVIIFLSSSIAKELKGGLYAQILAAVCIMGSILFVRAFGLFQPVVFDIFFWTLSIYLVIRYINSEQNKYLWLLGITIGIAFLNKYSMIFLIFPLLLILPFTKHRKLFVSKHFYFALLLAFITVLPNVIWQVVHHFPVIGHMEELRSSQLVNMDPATFLMEQLMMVIPATLVAFPGLIFLLISKHTKNHRLLAFVSIGVILLFLAMQGKGYYTAGIYPMLIAGGAVFFEFLLKRSYLRIAFIVLVLILEWQFLPMGKPIYEPEKLVRYFDKMQEVTGTDDVRRDEDNLYHKLPQDYSDMLGWRELSENTYRAWQLVENKEQCIIYAENYGEAGAVNVYGKKYNLPNAISFNDNFQYWIPTTFDNEITTLIYINDEPGDDIKSLFSDIKLIEIISNPLAREYGVGVFLCKKPTSSFNVFWAERIKDI